MFSSLCLGPFVEEKLEIWYKELCQQPAPQRCCGKGQTGLMETACNGCWKEFLGKLTDEEDFELSFKSINCEYLGQHFWQLAKLYMGLEVKKTECNSAYDTDVSGLCSVIIHCPFIDEIPDWVRRLVYGVRRCRVKLSHSPRHTMLSCEKDDLFALVRKIEEWIESDDRGYNLNRVSGEDIILLLT